MKKPIFKLPLLALFASFSAFAIPQQPINGGTGVSNNNANIISLGGPILTSGSFTLSGAFSTTIIVSANSVVTFPSGTHTLASNDGSNASGTWGINITGTAGGGAPPTGAAGGDLTGSYPNPPVASNAITYAKFQQVASNSLVGNASGSLANATGITLGSTLVFSGSALQTTALNGDVSSSANSFSTTLATVNAQVGTFGSASVVPQVTLNGKGLVTNETDVTITPSAIGAPTTTGTGASGTWSINVTGSSATTTTATNANNGGTISTSANASYFPLFAASSINSNQPFNLGTGLTFNPSTNNLSTTTFTGALVGNATTASGAPPTGSAGGSFLNGTYPNPGIINNSIGNPQIRQGFAYSVMGNPTGSVTNIGDMVATSVGQVLRRDGSLLEFGAIDLTSSNAVSGALPFGNAGLGFTTATLGDLFYASATNTPGKLSDVAVNQVLTSGGVGAAPAYSASPTLTGLNLSGLTASALVATDASKNLTSSVSGLSPTFSGLSLSSTTPTNLTITDTTTGSANVASVNIFRGDVANGNSTVNYGTGSTSTWFVGLASTANGFTANAKDFVWRANSGDGGLGNVLFFGQTTADVTLPQGNLIVGLVNKGLTIKSAAVSAGTANAAIITGVTLSGGTVTINDSYVNTSTVCFFSVVTPGGTPGTAYGVTVAAGTVKVTSTSALDATVGNVGCLKGN